MTTQTDEASADTSYEEDRRNISYSHMRIPQSIQLTFMTDI